MAMSPFALTILGMEPTPPRRRPEDQDTQATSGLEAMPRMRQSRRATSHYNSFQTVCSSAQDSPPSYAVASRQKLVSRRPQEGKEILPKYTSTVNYEAKMLLMLESMNPLHGVSESDWREVYVVLRGTLFSVHRVKDGGPGKLLRSYTLQHAEVGLASDTQHTLLVPQSRLAHLIPVSARRKAWTKDPDLYKPVRQSILRLRIETDQMLLADSNEEAIHDLINKISASIDISFSIDERNIPRQCTVPRRRRRQPPPMIGGNLNDPALLAEQERILRDMYPAFAQEIPATTTTTRPELERTTTTDSTAEPLATPVREEDDLDLAVMREDFANPNTPAPTQPSDTSQRPGMFRQTTASSLASTFSTDMVYATSPSNFTEAGKWQPPHPRTAAQIQRYTRRCMPILLAEAVRASDVLMCHGRRVKINWRMEMLEEWELSPPSYRSHHFETTTATTSDLETAQPTDGLEMQRTTSHSSRTPSEAAANGSPLSSRSGLERPEDQIEAVDTDLANLEFGKVVSHGEKSPTRVSVQAVSNDGEEKGAQARRTGVEEVHGVVFCF
ncbi:hypothetical protein LTR86_002176 [Recurvomyces mirabilis]|nr:hypothetical protein LTR86_002176 [Recurvomyces mirabilis]